MVLEKSLESSLDCKEIQPVNPKGNQAWIFLRRPDAEAEASTLWPPDAEAEASTLWPPDAKNRLIGKYPDAGKDWRQEEKGTIEDEMVRWHHWLNEHEFEQAPRDGVGQRNLVCCSPWDLKELDMTEQLNWNEQDL